MSGIRFPRRGGWQYASRDGVVVSCWGLPAPFRRAFLTIAANTRAYYRTLFGAETVPAVELNVRMEPGLPLRLWTNGADRIYLTLSNKSQLAPAPKSGVRHVHGITHELAHIVLYRALINLSELAEGWGEGWAVYLASFWAVPRLFQRHGAGLWPYPYDYRRFDGPGRLIEQFGATSEPPSEPVPRAVYDLYRLEQGLGSKEFAARFRSMLRRRMRADDFNERIAAALRRLPREGA